MATYYAPTTTGELKQLAAVCKKVTRSRPCSTVGFLFLSVIRQQGLAFV